jgi:hypothetical protein
METAQQLVLLPDGTYALIERSMSWGEATIIILLATLVFVELYKLWRHRSS